MDVRVPLDNLAVPLVEFAAVLDEAARRWKASPEDRYLAGVLASLQWVATITDRSPITGSTGRADPVAIGREQLAADAVVYGWAHAPAGVNQEWATGSAAAIGWVRGSSSRAPLTLAGVRFAA
jgi:hypothetical protein